jgi:hypothetical protein
MIQIPELEPPIARDGGADEHEGSNYQSGVIQRSDHVLFRDSIQFGWTGRFLTLGGQDVAQVMGSMGPS